MELDDILTSLFPAHCKIEREGTLLSGTGWLPGGCEVNVLGAGQKQAIGVNEAIWLSARVLEFSRSGNSRPILLLIDTASQRMSKRDELLGLNEYLSHLAKSLLIAEANGHPTIGLLYGGSAAGAFIATGLACSRLVALPDAHPEVMDLPSMARITRLPLGDLEEKAGNTPVFAPGLANFMRMGGIAEIWDPARSLAEQFAELLAETVGESRLKIAGKSKNVSRADTIADKIVSLAMGR